MKKAQLLYWVPTTLLVLMMAGGGLSYFAMPEMAMEGYKSAGFPTWVMYFNGLAKITGGIVLMVSAPRVLKEWVYAGYCYVLLLALIAHLSIGDGMFGGALVGLVLWSLSYWQWRKRA